MGEFLEKNGYLFRNWKVGGMLMKGCDSTNCEWILLQDNQVKRSQSEF